MPQQQEEELEANFSFQQEPGRGNTELSGFGDILE